MSTTGARLLVVDDDPDMLRLLSMRLSSAGYQVTAVTSAETALTQLEIEHPQLVLSDVRLPGRDGLQLFGVAIRHPEAQVGLRARDGLVAAVSGQRALQVTVLPFFRVVQLVVHVARKRLLALVEQVLELGQLVVCECHVGLPRIGNAERCEVPLAAGT